MFPPHMNPQNRTRCVVLYHSFQRRSAPSCCEPPEETEPAPLKLIWGHSCTVVFHLEQFTGLVGPYNPYVGRAGVIRVSNQLYNCNTWLGNQLASVVAKKLRAKRWW